MQYEDRFYVRFQEVEYDSDLNPIVTQSDYELFGMCYIGTNGSAQRTRLNDGTEYIYQYTIITKLNEENYDKIPKEGDMVHIHKADGTIDTEMPVRGFVTLKKKFLKIWL